MIETSFLAKYLGILMLAMGIVGIFRYELIQLWLKRALVRPSVFFLIGVFEFMVGLLIILGHQQWGGFTAGLVSLLGWLAVLESALYLTLPKASIGHLLGRMDKSPMIIATGIISVGLGVVLTLSGFQVI
jgi:hypothetical protein